MLSAIAFDLQCGKDNCSVLKSHNFLEVFLWKYDNEKVDE